MNLVFQTEGKTEEEGIEVGLDDYMPHGQITINADADFYNYAIISGDGSLLNPFIIEDLNITLATGIGISINTVTAHFIIRNCYIIADIPIKIDSSYNLNSSIIGNTLDSLGGLDQDLYLNHTNDIDIIGNTFLSAYSGIYGDFAYQLLISNNYFTGCWNAIDFIDANSNTIIENVFEGNDGDQYLHCNNLYIYNNTWINNYYGLYLGNCDTVFVIDNIFIDNFYTAIHLYSSTNVRVYRNWFVDNNLVSGGSQVHDELGFNAWSHSGIGNFWSNYEGEGSYEIPSNNEDPYPIYDTDDDGLDEYKEVFVYFTDRYDPDTDDDLMPDGWEVDYALDPHTDDAYEDADSDELVNILEYYYQCDPQKEDTDEDQIFDGYEVFNYLNPLLDDADLDQDGDGLSNLEEFNLGTKANNHDSDDDGMSDSWENDVGLNPLVNDAWADPDNDSLNNFLEYIYNCNPFNNDTDGDNHIDSWEVLHGTDPTNSSDYPDVTLDTITEETNLTLSIIVFTLIGLTTLILYRRKK